MENTPIVVVGAGIAGLSFACAFVQDERNVGKKVIVLDKRNAPLSGDDEESKRYSYSLSVRGDVGGVQALKKLGIYENVSSYNTGTTGFVIQFIFWNRFINAIDLRGFNSEGGFRTTRKHLWNELETLADSLGIEIIWGCTISNIDGNKISYSINEELHSIDASVIIGADGHKSIIRSLVSPKDNLNFLNTYIIGCHVYNKEPLKSMKGCHGMLMGKGKSIFFSDENDKILISFSTKTTESEEPLIERLNNVELLKHEAEEMSSQFPNPIPQWIKEVPSNLFFSVICRDKMPPTEGNGKIVFIGDAAHAVSPFAGAGANMALWDGVQLADELSKEEEISSALSNFISKSYIHSKSIVKQQRQTISMLHVNNIFSVFCRNCFLFSIGTLMQYPKFIIFSLIAAIGSVTWYTIRNYNFFK